MQRRTEPSQPSTGHGPHRQACPHGGAHRTRRHARSKLFQAQLKDDARPDAGLISSSTGRYFSLGHSNKFETYGYDEFVPRDESIQDRLEFHDSSTWARSRTTSSRASTSGSRG